MASPFWVASVMKVKNCLIPLLLAIGVVAPSAGAAQGRLSCNPNNAAMPDACKRSDSVDAQSAYEKLLGEINGYRLDRANQDWLIQRRRELDNRVNGWCRESWQFTAGCEVDAYNQAISALESLHAQLRPSGQQVRSASSAASMPTIDAPERSEQSVQRPSERTNERQTAAPTPASDAVSPSIPSSQAPSSSSAIPSETDAATESLPSVNATGNEPSATDTSAISGAQQEQSKGSLLSLWLLLGFGALALVLRKPLAILARRALSLIGRN